MAIKKCECKRDYEDEGFKTMCPSCYAKSMNSSKKTIKAHTMSDKDIDIHRQVFVKIASEQLKGVSVTEIVNYAKELEKIFNKW